MKLTIATQIKRQKDRLYLGKKKPDKKSGRLINILLEY